MKFVSPWVYNIAMTTNWNKHSYVCPTCDGLFEMTINAYRTIDQELCPSCFNSLSLMSVVNATILPTTTKEEKMETTPQVMTLDWVENDVVTNKTYTESDIRNMVWTHKNLTNKQNEWYKKESQLRTLLEEVYADSEEQETLASIAEIFDVPLTKEIDVTIWVRIDASIEVDMADGDYDLESFVSDNLNIDSVGSELSVNNYDIDRVEEGAY